MGRFHLVRTGALGRLGWFSAVDSLRYPRGSRVIVRSPYGLEVGEVLSPPQGERSESPGDGVILRGMTVQDELLESRLMKNRDRAFEACRARLAELGIAATLVDVDHLFDGRTLVFYFLGQPPEEAESLAAELTEAYDAQAQFRDFTAAVAAGCGPGCGTQSAGGGCTSCATGCAVTGACQNRRSA